MTGLRMFVSMVLIDGAVLFVLYALIRVFGQSGSVASFAPAAVMVTAGLFIRPRARRARRGPAPEPSPLEAQTIGSYR